MIKARPSITFDLEKTGQRITLDLKEANELYSTLTKFLKGDNNNITAITNNKGRRHRKRNVITTSATTAKSATKKGGKRGRKVTRRGRRGKRPAQSSAITTRRTKTASSASMSDSKKKEILNHINKKISSDTKPRTLTNLLKGISYTPNHIPFIRQMVEGQSNIAKKKIGKRTYYLSKQQPSSKSAAAE